MLNTPIFLNAHETQELTLLGAKGIDSLDTCSHVFLDKLLGTMILQLSQQILLHGDDFPITISVSLASKEAAEQGEYLLLCDRHKLKEEAPFLFLDM